MLPGADVWRRASAQAGTEMLRVLGFRGDLNPQKMQKDGTFKGSGLFFVLHTLGVQVGVRV